MRWSTLIVAVLLSLCILCIVPQPSHALLLPVSNASFEQWTLSEGDYTIFGAGLPGWTVATGSAQYVGVWRPRAGRYNPGVPDGYNVAYSHGTMIHQTLTHQLTANTIYELLVDVGNPSPWGGYTLELCAGETPLLGTTSFPAPSAGYFATASIRYEASAGDPLIGQQLQIRLKSAGDEVDFDNVRLNATPLTAPIPEPGTAVLLGGVFAAFLVERCRRRRSCKRP